MTNHQLHYSTKTDFETLVRRRVDQLTAGRYADQLAVAAATDDVGRRRGLLPDLLVEMGLCDLCQVRRGRP